MECGDDDGDDDATTNKRNNKQTQQQTHATTHKHNNKQSNGSNGKCSLNTCELSLLHSNLTGVPLFDTVHHGGFELVQIRRRNKRHGTGQKRSS